MSKIKEDISKKIPEIKDNITVRALKMKKNISDKASNVKEVLRNRMPNMEKNIAKVMLPALVISLVVMGIGLLLSNELIMNIGLFCLILTPIIRVITSIFTFAVEKDTLYVCITLFVLLIIILSFIVGKS